MNKTLYVPSTLKIDLILRHIQFIYPGRSCKNLAKCVSKTLQFLVPEKKWVSPKPCLYNEVHKNHLKLCKIRVKSSYFSSDTDFLSKIGKNPVKIHVFFLEPDSKPCICKVRAHRGRVSQGNAAVLRFECESWISNLKWFFRQTDPDLCIECMCHKTGLSVKSANTSDVEWK